MSNKLRSFLLSIFVIFLTAPLVFAEEWSLQVDWPTSPGPDGGRDLTTESSIAELVAYFYEWGILIGVLIFFGILVYAGFRYLTSTGDPSKLQDARKRIIAGFSGVILLLGSYLILDTINPELTQIREVSPAAQRMGSHEFTASMMDDDNLCEFAFITVQEDDDAPTGEDETTHFLIPGLSRVPDGEVFPVRGKACTAEKKESEILEIREYEPTGRDNGESEGYWMLVYRESGEEVDENERIYFGDETSDDLKELYGQRYEQIDGSISITDNDILKTLKNAREINNYNIFEPNECEEIIGNENFNRPRCLELNDSGDLREWRRIGYASLTKALDSLGDLTNPDETNCPNADSIAGAELGYERDGTGGGCTVAFYDGEETRWLRDNIVTCSDQISRPSADMNTFDGLVDRETNCLELNRYESPLDIDLEDVRNRVSVGNETGLSLSRISICEGHSDRCIANSSYRSCGTSDNCTGQSYLLPDGKYTVEGFSRNSAVSFEEYGPGDDECEILDFAGNPDGIICNIDLEEDREFTLEEI